MLWSIADKNITSSKATYTAQKRRSGLKLVCVTVPDCVGVAAWAEVDAGAVVGVDAVAGAGAPARFCVLIFLPFPGSFWG